MNIPESTGNADDGERRRRGTPTTGNADDGERRRRGTPTTGNAVPRAQGKPRLTQLDFLRGIAILLVMGAHSFLSPNDAGRFSRLSLVWHTFGWTGVDLFFVLSGFLIGGLLFNEISKTGQLDVKRFIIRRAFKIGPLYYGFLVFAVAVFALFMHISYWRSAGHFWSQFVSLQNYEINPYRDYKMRADSYYPYLPLGHTWSLSVEEHFYLLLPLLLLLLIRRKRADTRAIIKFLPVAALIVMVVCLALRLSISGKPFVPQVVMWRTHFRMDSLFFGVLLAYFWQYHPERLAPLIRRPIALLLVGLALISPMTWVGARETFVWTFGYTMLSLGYGFILMAFMSSTLPNRRQGRMATFFRSGFARSVAWVGFFSYPIYLIHQLPGYLPALWLSKHHIFGLHSTLGWLVLTVIYFGTAIALGAGIGRLVEQPSLALRDRLFPSNTPISTTSPELTRDTALSPAPYH